MEYRNLGRTGVKVSPFCLGAMNFGGPTTEEDSITIINRAFEAGINFIDTANVYNGGESERIVGKALAQGGKRELIFLATKVYSNVGPGPNDRGASRYHILKACEDSLRRLQTDHIDLYQLHRPPAENPQDETLRAFDDLVHSGKVRYIGSSTFAAWMLMEALAISDRYNLAHYICEQPPYNLLDRRIENELVPLCIKYGLAIIPWSPLAGGILSGKYTTKENYPDNSRATRSGSFFTDRITNRAMQVASSVDSLAKERGLTSAQLAILWCKDQPGITSPIIGPRTMSHLEEFIPIMDMTLSDEDRKSMDEFVHPGNAVADFFNSNEWMKTRITD